MRKRRRSPSRSRCARRWQTPGATAALVTPDRALARRVLAALARWNVPVERFRRRCAADTPAGVFARLAAEAALGGLAPVTLLALLKHPLLRLGARENAHTALSPRWNARSCAGRGRSAGTDGLVHALENFRAQRDTTASQRSAQGS